MKTSTPLMLLMLAMTGSGCQWSSMAYESCREQVSDHRAAGKAWREHKAIYEGIPCHADFKEGFKAGYRFARRGYDCCEPPLPRHYWRMYGWTQEDRDHAKAWSDGFSHGALIAQQGRAVGPSALDAATGQPPPGVPDVTYYSQNPGSFAPGASGEGTVAGPDMGASPMYGDAGMAYGGAPGQPYANGYGWPSGERMPGAGPAQPSPAIPNSNGAMFPVPAPPMEAAPAGLPYTSGAAAGYGSLPRTAAPQQAPSAPMTSSPASLSPGLAAQFYEGPMPQAGTSEWQMPVGRD